MKKILAIAMAALMLAALPLSAIAADVTATVENESRGLQFAFEAGSLDEVKDLAVAANGKSLTGETLFADAIAKLGDWSGTTKFTGKIIIEKVLEAEMATTAFKVADTNTTLFAEAKADDFVTDFEVEVGQVVGVNGKIENGIFVFDEGLDNPLFNVDFSAEYGTLSVSYAKDLDVDKEDVKITLGGKTLSADEKTVNGETVVVSFDVNADGDVSTGTVLSDKDDRVAAAAALMNKKVAANDFGVASITYTKATGEDLKVESVLGTATVPAAFGSCAVFNLKDSSYQIKSFANSGVIELFQAMFGDVVSAEITGYTYDPSADAFTKIEDKSGYIAFAGKSAGDIKSAIAEELISVLIPADVAANEATMNLLYGKAATALVTFADNTTANYAVIFAPAELVYMTGETTASVN